MPLSKCSFPTTPTADVVLCPAPHVLAPVLPAAPMKLLLERFRAADGSIEALAQALKLAAMQFCAAAPLAALAAPALAADRAAVIAAAVALRLPPDVVAAAAARCTVVGPAIRAPPSNGEVSRPVSTQVQVVADAAVNAGAAWACWRLGLLWMHKIAETTGA